MALTLRSTKGSALTHTEQDENYSGLASGSNWAATIAATSNITLTGTLVVSSTITPQGQILAAAGSAAAPSNSFASAATTGMFIRAGTSNLGFAQGGTQYTELQASGTWALSSGATIGWNSVAFGTGSIDLALVRDAASTLAQRVGTTAQTFRIYNTFTDASNYERLSFSFSSSNSVIRQEAAGTGSTSRSLSIRCDTGGNLNFGIGGVDYWRFSNGGAHLLALTDNAYDLGSSGANRPRALYWGTQALGPDGAVGTPSFAFANATTTGLYQASSRPIVSVSGTAVVAFDNSFGIRVAGTGLPLAFETALLSGVFNTLLYGEAAGVLAQRNGTTAQTFRLYNTFTDASNYERGALKWSGNRLILDVEVLGTGALKDIRLGATWDIQRGTSGHLIAVTDNTNDIGASGATRPRTGYFGTSVITPLLTSTGGVQAFSGTAIPAAGTAGTGITFSSTSNFGVFFGSGAPTLSAAQGSLYLRSDGTTTNNRAYINTNGSTTWTALTTVA